MANNGSYDRSGSRGGRGGRSGVGGSGQGRTRNQDPAVLRYSGAPYNFIPFAQKVVEDYKNAGELPAHNQMESEHLSGEITFMLTAETPVFVGGGDGNTFYRTIPGEYAIPGSSIKGLIRNNMQILGMGSIADDVEDYRIMYRTVGDARSKRSQYYRDTILRVKTVNLPRGGQITLPTNVQAGYICKKNGRYTIRGTVGEPINPRVYGELNYYTLSEKTILVDDAREERFQLDRTRLQNVSFHQQTEYDRRRRRDVTAWVGKPNNDYYPYSVPVYYKADGRTATSVWEKGRTSEKPVGYQEGYLISTGPMNKKKHLYVIPQMSEKVEYPITKADVKAFEQDISAFKRDYEMKKNSLQGTKIRCAQDRKTVKEKSEKFFRLPGEGEVKPVFFIREGGRMYFGFTPYLRIFYKYSTADGLPDEQKDSKEPKMDYARSILGFSGDKDSYRSRVSFEDAPLASDMGVGSEVNVVLGEPKLSSYMDYLKQEGEDQQETTYNDKGFSFRGIKQYWLRKDVVSGKDNGNEKVISGFRPLNAGSSFTETVHFKNLRPAELGLLLWCIYQGESSQWNIGKAKAYGYGRMSISRPVVKVYDPAKMYGAGLTLDVYRDGEENVDEYIRFYQQELKEKLGLPDRAEVKRLPGIREFLAMKDSERMPSPDRIRYMSIDAKEYQNRDRALPTVDELMQTDAERGQTWEQSLKELRDAPQCRTCMNKVQKNQVTGEWYKYCPRCAQKYRDKMRKKGR